MKKNILLLLLCLSYSLTAEFKDLTKEEKWQRIKEVFFSGEVSYSILATIVAGIGMQHLWPWLNNRVMHQSRKKQREAFLMILKKVEINKGDKEVAVKNFCERELYFTKDKIIAEYNDQGMERTMTIKLTQPELRINPNLKKIYTLVGTRRNAMEISEVTRTLTDGDVITQIKMVI